jgi:hypothetical protein
LLATERRSFSPFSFAYLRKPEIEKFVLFLVVFRWRRAGSGARLPNRHSCGPSWTYLLGTGRSCIYEANLGIVEYDVGVRGSRATGTLVGFTGARHYPITEAYLLRV